ncbi:hypothetical protein GLOIN_2v1886361 [Rhizophagus irregularis DAOM 181602=DAOM 197198]|nr:hypothetical protein GLOIN_2v1886361 [Rhizophagus irregularis DAOM 181602=DAOM 197198]
MIRFLNSEKLLRFAEVKAENAKLKQIIEENARHDSENAELKSRTQNGEEAMPVVMVPTVDVPDFVIDKLNNEVGQAPSE